MKGPGRKPPQSGLFRRETIGPDECPVIVRWTILKTPLGKLLVHHFLPNADDRAVHDHPASFVTLVLRGGYDDRVPCTGCDGEGLCPGHVVGGRCMECGGEGVVVGDRMRPGMVRLRRAEHTHRTRVGPEGCWTVVLMARKRREWGFWREGRWMHWREHECRFGYGMRCPEEPK